MNTNNDSQQILSISTKSIKTIMMALLVLAMAGAEMARGHDACKNNLVTEHNTKYKDNNNGTITDTTTGLMWKICSEGQIWKDSTCVGFASSYKWQVAKDHAHGVSYAGYSDWRVPSIEELNTLVYCSNSSQVKYKRGTFDSDGGCSSDRDYQSPTINQVMFPNTPANYFWSASPDAYNSFNAWLLDFNYGDDNVNFRYSSYNLRMVRFEQ